MLCNDDCLDLRAGFYHKFYVPSSYYTTLKFLKEGKVVSHWAKAYRGIVLRHIAKAHIDTIEDFIRLDIPNLAVQEIIEKKNHREIVYNILNI